MSAGIRAPRAWAWWVSAVVVLLLVGAGKQPMYAPFPAPTGEDRAPALESRIAAAAPRGPYIVIDRINNRIRLCKKDAAILEAPCSTGSGRTLTDAEGGRTWEFNTPQGQFRVISKSTDPVWRKPDWAFIEDGKPVPERDADRFEYGSLGEYGLGFGNGYLIHGTLYERLLGRSVSHGCIRVGKDPLRTIYETCPLGTPIFIH